MVRFSAGKYRKGKRRHLGFKVVWSGVKMGWLFLIWDQQCLLGGNKVFNKLNVLEGSKLLHIKHREQVKHLLQPFCNDCNDFGILIIIKCNHKWITSYTMLKFLTSQTLRLLYLANQPTFTKKKNKITFQNGNYSKE